MDIKPLENKHTGEDIYIIASGKSVDFYDLSFFDNKITIGINQIYKMLPTTYLVRKEHRLMKDIISQVPDTIHVISNGDCGNNNNINKQYIKQNKLNVYVFDHDKNNCQYKGLPDGDKIVVSWSTITCGIHLAAYMGAKNIILVGHDCGTIDGESNCSGYHTNTSRNQANEDQYINWLKKIENQTIKLKKDIKVKYGCNIISLNPFINFNLEGHIYKK